MYYGNACGDLDDGTYGDTGGDSCAWYEENSWGCGAYDTYDYYGYKEFDSYAMCCGCGGGLSAICASTSGPFKDIGGDGCDCCWADDAAAVAE